MEVNIPESKICPFQPYSIIAFNMICKKSKCELWSTTMSMCSILIGMNALLSIADAVRGLSQSIKDQSPD